MKRKYINLYLLFIIFILFSCSTTDPVIPELSFEYSIDTLYCENGLSLNANSSGIKSFDITTINDSVFVYIKSSKSDTLYKYYYGIGFKVVDKIPLAEEYSNKSNLVFPVLSKFSKLGKIKSIKVINQDSIIIMQENCVSIFNMSSRKIDFKFICNDLDTTYWYLVNNYNPVKYSFSDKKFYTELIRYDIPANSEGVIETELNACIDIKTSEISALPYKIPSDVIVKDRNLSEHFAVTEKKVICGFSTSPKVYVYSIKNKKVKTEKLKSPNQDKYIYNDKNTKGDFDRARSNYLNSFLYSSIVYDNSNQKLIRTYFMPIKERNEEGFMPSSYKPFGCIIYDNEFNPLGEIVLNLDIYPNMWFATNGKIYALLLSGYPEYLKILKIEYEL